MKDSRLEKMMKEYNNIEIPKQLRERVEASIEQAKEDNKMEEQKVIKFPFWTKAATGLVAAMAAFVILVNTNHQMAYAMSNIPILGSIVKVVTFKTFEHENKDMSARVEVPKVEVEEKSDMKPAAEQLNKNVQEYTDQIIEQYKADVAATGGEGYEEVTTDYEVVTDNDKLFSIRINTVVQLNTAGISIKIYHIDKTTNKLVGLKDICKTDVDYKNILTEEIKRQMREQMKKNENVVYFIDDEDIPEVNWTGITDEANFYFNDEGKLTFVFDKYEAAPGYMGSFEFVIPDEIANTVLLEKYLD